MGDLLEFTGEYYTQVKRSKALADTLALDLVISMQDQHNLDISDQQFVYDMAWVVKFLEVLLDNQFGVSNRLATLMESMRSGESRSKE